MKSIPRHENQHTAAMWWTVDHVASNQCGVRRGGGDGCLHCVTLAIFVFPLTFICIFISAHQHWYLCTFSLYDYCSVCFPLQCGNEQHYVIIKVLICNNALHHSYMWHALHKEEPKSVIYTIWSESHLYWTQSLTTLCCNGL